MPVAKTTRECYEVRDGRRGGEWANITLASWDNPPQPGYTRTSMYYGGEIQIHSSFGSWGHSWSSCAVPFKRFLIGAEFDYVFTKFMGTKLDRFDGEASAREVLKWIIEDRRHNGMSKAEARSALRPAAANSAARPIAVGTTGITTSAACGSSSARSPTSSAETSAMM